MAYRWKPSKSQRAAFAEKMRDPVEAAAYEARKEAKAEKRRSMSQFDYETAGGRFVPTESQYRFAIANYERFTDAEKQAANIVVSGYTCNERVAHDAIHIINEAIRSGKF